MAEFRDRVKGLRRVKASELLPSPENWRRHPDSQATALRALLAEVGFAGAILAREDGAGHLVVLDGHLRRDLLPDEEVPVLVLDVTEDEGRKILATHDPIGAMAEADGVALRALVESISSSDPALSALLARLSSEAETAIATDSPPGEFPEVGDGLATDHRCPKCGYEWSGSCEPGRGAVEPH